MAYNFILIFVLFLSASCANHVVDIRREIVMSDGMQIAVTNEVGTITIHATKGFERCFTWEGDTRCVEMMPREERWYGSYGIYFPGSGNHWKEHNRVTRGMAEEGQQHFNSIEAAIKWIYEGSNKIFNLVYTDDGLVVGWHKAIKPTPGPGSSIDVCIWQIYVNGKKPNQLPGSQNDKIVVKNGIPNGLGTDIRR